MYVLNRIVGVLGTMKHFYNVTFRFSRDFLERFDVDTAKANDIRAKLLASRPVLLEFGNAERIIFPSQLEEVVFTYFPEESDDSD